MEKITFKELALSPNVLKGIENMGYIYPSPIQEKTIPVVLEGYDIIGQAQTGTGKTLAFGSVLLSKIQREKCIRGLIISPTRELALQIEEELKRIGAFTRLSIVSVYGGADIDKQMRLINKGAHIVVGTPGRIIDLMKRHVLDFRSIQYLVLDEADEMLNMGFKEDIETILQQTPDDKQTLLFSATMPTDIKKIASFYMHDNYQHIQVKAKSLTATTVKQYYFEARSHQKFEVLCRILDSREMNNTLIFCRTKRSVDEVVAAMQQRHYNVEAMHGDLSQSQRTNTLNRFKKGVIQYLVATDVAARGIDVENITHVINYELPHDEEMYIHRIGRTGRANRKGEAYSIVTNREKNDLLQIEKRTNSHIEKCDIPSLDEIFDKKMKELLFDVQEEMLKGKHQKFKDVIKDIPQNMRTDVMATLLSMCYEQRIGFDYSEDIKKDEYDRLFLNCGSMDKIKIPDIVQFLMRYGKINKRDIGHIELKRKFTFVDVKSSVSEYVVKNCHRQKIRNRRVQIEYCGEK